MNNKLFFDFISFVEKVLHLIILGMVIFLCFEEVMSAVSGGGIRVESVLMLFIYLEIMQMVNIFFSTGKIPIRYPLYIGCLLYTSPSPRDRQKCRMPSSA